MSPGNHSSHPAAGPPLTPGVRWRQRAHAFLRARIWRASFLISLSVAILFAWSMVREIRLIMAQPLSSWTEDQTADCAVVVTGGTNRVREGFDLLARHAVQKLIISGVNPQVELRDIFPQMPFYGEIREQDVILERRSRTTYGNAQQSLPLVEALRCRDIILVTSRVHIYRTYRTFRAEFPPTIQILPRAVVAGTAVPSWAEAALEALKSIFYSTWAY
jgi:uncharacterized SAM-binding protein YcdF (DUF218 family)